MAVINRKEVFNLANKLDLNIFHFARGTYPKADGCFAKLPFNRFFIPVSDGGTVRSYIRDDKDNFFLQTDKIYFVPAGHTAAFFLPFWLKIWILYSIITKKFWEARMDITISFCLGALIFVGCCALAVWMTTHKQQRGMLDPLNVLFAGVLLSAVVLFAPGYFAVEPEGPFRFIKSVLFSFYSYICSEYSAFCEQGYGIA